MEGTTHIKMTPRLFNSMISKIIFLQSWTGRNWTDAFSTDVNYWSWCGLNLLLGLMYVNQEAYSYRARLKSFSQVWWIMLLLLLTTSAFLPAAFTKPGRSLLAEPCTCKSVISCPRQIPSFLRRQSHVCPRVPNPNPLIGRVLLAPYSI